MNLKKYEKYWWIKNSIKGYKLMVVLYTVECLQLSLHWSDSSFVAGSPVVFLSDCLQVFLLSQDFA